jgi:hypothetical protein
MSDINMNNNINVFRERRRSIDNDVEWQIARDEQNQDQQNLPANIGNGPNAIDQLRNMFNNFNVRN